MEFLFQSASTQLGITTAAFTLAIVALAIWTVVLKGFALWHSARNYQKKWFIALLIINTVGILEIVYLVWFRKGTSAGTTPSLFNAPEGPASSPSA